MIQPADSVDGAQWHLSSRRKSLHITVVGVNWPPETFLERRYAALAARGHRVSVICQRAARRHTIPGVVVYELRSWRTWSRTLSARGLARLPLRAFSNGRQKLQTILLLSALEPDVVHFEWVTAASGHLPILPFVSAPIVVSCRGKQVNVLPHLSDQQQYAARTQRVFRLAAGVHCVSDAMLQDAMRLGMPKHKAHVIRPAVDPAAFAPVARRAEPEPLRVVSVGGLLWRKGYEYAIRAFELLKLPPDRITYTIIGDGPEMERVRYTIDDCNLGAQVRVTGQLSPDAVAEQLRQSDIFLHASLAEGISNAVLEAMASGLPVVCTDCGGMREVIQDDDNGLIVPVRDPVRLSAALARLVSDSALREQLSVRGRQRIIEAFTLERQTDEFEALYAQVVSERAS